MPIGRGGVAEGEGEGGGVNGTRRRRRRRRGEGVRCGRAGVLVLVWRCSSQVQ